MPRVYLSPYRDEASAAAVWQEEESNDFHPSLHLVINEKHIFRKDFTLRDASIMMIPYLKISVYALRTDEDDQREYIDVYLSFYAPHSFQSAHFGDLTKESLLKVSSSIPCKSSMYSSRAPSGPWYCMGRENDWKKHAYLNMPDDWHAMEECFMKRVSLYRHITAWTRRASQGTLHQSLLVLAKHIRGWAEEQNLPSSDIFITKEEKHWDKSSFLLMMMVCAHRDDTVHHFIKTMESIICVYKCKILPPTYEVLASWLKDKGHSVHEREPQENYDEAFHRYAGYSRWCLSKLPSSYPIKSIDSETLWKCHRQDLYDFSQSRFNFVVGESLPLEFFLTFVTHQTFITLERFSNVFKISEEQPKNILPQKFFHALEKAITHGEDTRQTRKKRNIHRHNRKVGIMPTSTEIGDIEDLFKTSTEEFYKTPSNKISPCARLMIHKNLSDDFKHPKNQARVFLVPHLLQWAIRHSEEHSMESLHKVQTVYRSLFSLREFPHYPTSMDTFFSTTDHGRQFGGLYRSYIEKWNVEFMNSLSTGCERMRERGFCPFDGSLEEDELRSLVGWCGGKDGFQVNQTDPCQTCANLQEEAHPTAHLGYMCNPNGWLEKNKNK